METRFLLSVDVLKDYGLIYGNVDDSQLGVLIRRAQKKEVQQVLGTALLNKLLELTYEKVKNGTAVPDDYKNLIEEYVIPYFILCVELRAFSSLRIKTTAKTVGSSSDQYITTGSTQDVSNARNEIEDDLQESRNILIDYLVENTDKFPEYLERNPGEVWPNSRESSAGSSMLFVTGGQVIECGPDVRGYKPGER